MFRQRSTILTFILGAASFAVLGARAAPLLNGTGDLSDSIDVDGITELNGSGSPIADRRFPVVPPEYSIVVEKGAARLAPQGAYDVTLDALCDLSRLVSEGTIGHTTFHSSNVKVTVRGIHPLEPVNVLEAAYGIWSAMQYYSRGGDFSEAAFGLLKRDYPVAFIEYRVYNSLNDEDPTTSNSSQSDAELIAAFGVNTPNVAGAGTTTLSGLVKTPTWSGSPIPVWSWYMPLNSAIVQIMKSKPNVRKDVHVVSWTLWQSVPSYQFRVTDISDMADRNHLTRDFILAMCRSARDAGRQQLSKEAFRMEYAFYDQGVTTPRYVWQLTIKDPVYGRFDLGANVTQTDASTGEHQLGGVQSTANTTAAQPFRTLRTTALPVAVS